MRVFAVAVRVVCCGEWQRIVCGEAGSEVKEKLCLLFLRVYKLPKNTFCKSNKQMLSK